MTLLDNWVNMTDKGNKHWKDGRIFIMEGHIVGSFISVITDVKHYDPSNIKKPAFERW